MDPVRTPHFTSVNPHTVPLTLSLAAAPGASVAAGIGRSTFSLAATPLLTGASDSPSRTGILIGPYSPLRLHPAAVEPQAANLKRRRAPEFSAAAADAEDKKRARMAGGSDDSSEEEGSVGIPPNVRRTGAGEKAYDDSDDDIDPGLGVFRRPLRLSLLRFNSLAAPDPTATTRTQSSSSFESASIGRGEDSEIPEAPIHLSTAIFKATLVEPAATHAHVTLGMSPPRLSTKKSMDVCPPVIRAHYGESGTLSPIESLCRKVDSVRRINLMFLGGGGASVAETSDAYSLTTIGRGFYSIAYRTSRITGGTVQYVVKASHNFSAKIPPLARLKNAVNQFWRIRDVCVVAPLLNDPRVDMIAVQEYVEGVPLDEYEIAEFTPFTTSQIDDFKALLQAFVNEYKIGVSIDVLPQNFIVSKEGRIVFIDFDEGHDEFHGICQLRELILKTFPYGTPRFAQAIFLLNHLKTISPDIYEALFTASTIMAYKFYMELEEKGMDTGLAFALDPKLLVEIGSVDKYLTFMAEYPGLDIKPMERLPNYFLERIFAEPKSFAVFRGLDLKKLEKITKAQMDSILINPANATATVILASLA